MTEENVSFKTIKILIENLLCQRDFCGTISRITFATFRVKDYFLSILTQYTKYVGLYVIKTCRHRR